MTGVSAGLRLSRLCKHRDLARIRAIERPCLQFGRLRGRQEPSLGSSRNALIPAKPSATGTPRIAGPGSPRNHLGTLRRQSENCAGGTFARKFSNWTRCTLAARLPRSGGRRVVPTFGDRIQEYQGVTDIVTRELRKSGQVNVINKSRNGALSHRCHVARHHDRPKHGANSFRRCETYSAGVPIFLASARLRLFANRFLRRFTRAFW